ncbi:MAG: CCA tRNA nucleotidyltransferase [Terracidiphilus sp.]
MPDYIYLFENRLTADQQFALRQIREAAREAGTLLFLTGDAVRDLTNGQAVRDLEVSVHGNALKLKKTIQKLSGAVWGEDDDTHSLYLCFPGTVRVDLISTHRFEYPKPGKRVFHSTSIHEDLRRRDFTVNAMALSLNEGSFGLLMDPLNGAADIEGRTLRLVSNYGFLEEPANLIRATRYRARLGWEMEPRTLTRFENAKGEGVIEYLSQQARREELEQIGHEEDGLKVLRAMEAEGWMKVLYPAWTEAKADEEKLAALHTLAAELLAEGVRADISAAQMQLLTAKLTGREVAVLKKSMLRSGFVDEWSSMDSLASKFAKVLMSKENAIPSACFKLFRSYDPEAVLWLGFTTKDAAVKERYNLFLKVWPEARQHIPHALMQEMRITPELPGYADLVQKVFLELIDGRLTTPEEARAFLEPHSPPAPPPQVTIKRPRVKRGAEPKVKERSYEDEDEAEEASDEDLDDIGGDEEEIDLGISIPKADLEPDIVEEGESLEDELEDEEHKAVSTPVKTAKPAAAAKPVKSAKPETAVPAAKTVPLKPAKAEKPQPAPKSKPEAKPAAKSVAKPAVASVTKAKPATTPAKAKAAPAAKKVAAKVAVKAKAKAPAKAPAKKPVVKSKPAKAKPAPAARPKATQAAKAKKPTAKKADKKHAKKR